MIGPVIAAIVLTLLPVLFNNFWIFDQFWIGVFAQGVALAIVFLSYTMVTGEGGMISLCQITLAGIGAFATAPGGRGRLPGVGGDPRGALDRGAVRAPGGLPSLRIGDLYLACSRSACAADRAVRVDPFRVRQLRRRPAGTRPFGLGITDRIEMRAS